MKKKLLMGLTTAIVMGAASTTFAAANPFSDVPAGHWAYDAVTQLAADGVIEGYGDGTFLGNRNITRYEMAQMVAKALARNPQGTDRAALDRLAAEFADELNNLGVRVAELEKYADKVQWHGELRYRYWSRRVETSRDHKHKANTDNFQFRLLPTAEVNDHWKLKARLQASNNMKTNESGDFAMKFGYAEGTYDKFKLNVGKMPIYSNVDDGLVIDDFFSGAQLEFGSKVKVLLEGGRWKDDGVINDDPASYWGGELSYDNDKLYIGGSYKHFNSDDFRTRAGYKSNEDDANIWSAGLRYKIGSSLRVDYSYAQNTKADDYKNAWNAGLMYKGADKSKGSWGAGAYYRRLGYNAAIVPTYDTAMDNTKGVDLFLQWAPLKNTLTQINYFRGETLETDRDVDVLFGRVSFFF
ncbi:MAG: S-layer homology domain-containing protein [Selenomonadaceae bacterium]|nr:S-layer homology domain-containing protein [Selenomonadaceae bacterium]